MNRGVYAGPAHLIPVDAVKNAAAIDPNGRVFVLPEATYLKLASSFRNLRSLSWRLRTEATFLHPNISSMQTRFRELADTIDGLEPQQPAPEDGPDAQFWSEVWRAWESGTRGEDFLAFFTEKVRQYSGARVRDPV